MNRYPLAWIGISLLTGIATADLNTMPAARVHVRIVDGVPMRFTSKLSRVVEMNFTFGFNHAEGKPLVSRLLDQIARDYALGGKDAFAIQRFIGPGNGTSVGLPQTVFTLDDLMAADIVVANNVSSFDALRSSNRVAADAFETAVRGGRSVLSFHGTDEVGMGWSFVSQEFLPLNWRSHGNRTPVPVYKNDAERNHLVLEGVLSDSTRPMEVPMGMDSTGQEIMRADVPVRMINNENNRYATNLLTDPSYAPLTTCLLRYDPRSLDYSQYGTGIRYRYAGGHNYAFILKVGPGKSAYLPFGHAADELANGATSFDGGVGDLERFCAQMLFYLAGYNKEPCGSTVDCSGLPLVDSADHLVSSPDRVATVYDRAEFFEAGRVGFSYSGSAPYRAVLMDVRGKAVASRSGSGSARIEFDPACMRPGIYYLSVRIRSQAPRVQRYVIPFTQARKTK